MKNITGRGDLSRGGGLSGGEGCPGGGGWPGRGDWSDGEGWRDGGVLPISQLNWLEISRNGLVPLFSSSSAPRAESHSKNRAATCAPVQNTATAAAMVVTAFAVSDHDAIVDLCGQSAYATTLMVTTRIRSASEYSAPAR